MNREWLSDLSWKIKHLFPMFHGVRIYRPHAWKMMWQCLRKGFDDSYAWDFYNNVAEYIYPRLLDYFWKIDDAPGVPQKYYDKVRDEYIELGKKFDQGRGRFSNKEDEDSVLKRATWLWKESVWAMVEAFQDIINEEESWDEWFKYWGTHAELARDKYIKLNTPEEQKAYWDSFGFDREWRPGITFTRYDFSERLRKRGLKLFAEEFQNLWR